MRQTMRRLLALLCAMAVLFGLTACYTPDSTQETEPALQEQNTQPTKPQPTDPEPTDPELTDPEPTDPEPTEPKPTEPKPIDPQPTDPEPTEPLQTEPKAIDEIEVMQQLFAPQVYNIYNYLLRALFLRPEDASVSYLFMEGIQDVTCTVPTAAELAYLQGKLGTADLSDQKLVRIPAAYMDEILQEYLGITSETADTRYLVYWEETDTYYYIYSSHDYYRKQITVTQVEHLPNGNIRVFYTDNKADPNKVVTLQPNGDGYRVLSNIPVRLLTDDPQIEALMALFDWQVGRQFYNDALTSDYATAKDVDIGYLFYDGFWEESEVASAAEEAFLDANSSNHWRYMDLQRLPSEKMSAVLQEIFGITLEETNKVGLSYPYFEETDAYYHLHSGTHYAEITINRVENQGDGTIRMFYLRNGFPSVNMVATLKPNGNGYQILSNLPEAVQ